MPQPVQRKPRLDDPGHSQMPRDHALLYEFWGHPSGQDWAEPVLSDNGIALINIGIRSWHSILLRCREEEKAAVSFSLECESHGVGIVGPVYDWKCPGNETQSAYITRVRVNLVGKDAHFFKLEYRGLVVPYKAPDHDVVPGDTNWFPAGQWCGTGPDGYLNWLCELEFKVQRR